MEPTAVMRRRSIIVGLIVAMSSTAEALRVGTVHFNRRGALAAGFAAFPALAVNAISNPWDKGELNLKPEATKKRMRPDGFGGYVEREEPVAGVNPFAGMMDKDDDEPAPAPKPVKAPTKAAAVATRSSSPDLTLDELVANSVKSREEILGRTLDESEVAQIRAKVTELAARR